MPIILKNQTAEELHSQLGITLRQARMIQAVVIRKGKLPEAQAEISEKALKALRAATEIPNLTVSDKQISPQDGFAKYLFHGDGPEPFEAVRIPLLHRADDQKYIVCVSSQVGCALGCAFCYTGKMGFIRNLSAWEMADQVIKIRDDSEHPVRGVVFMGMGEPLLNYEATMTAVRLINNELKIGMRNITMSTIGYVPGIYRLAAERLQLTLAVSLHAAGDGLRRKLVPGMSRYLLKDILAACQHYFNHTGRRVTFEYCLLKGVNDSQAEAAALASLLKGLNCHVNLIPFNEVLQSNFRRPQAAAITAFRRVLENDGITVTQREQKGAGIQAACGQLRRQSGSK